MFRGSPEEKRNLIILFCALVIIMLGFGIVIPILPFYVERMGASGADLGLIMAIFAAMQFIFSPMWGDVSDRIGRRPVIMIGIVGNALAQVLFGLSTQLWMIYAARALSGILSAATFPAAMAFISDTTSEENRGGGMGILGAAMGVGMTLGPGIGGVMARFGLSAPFFAAAGISLIILVLVYLFLPESLPPERRVGKAGKLRTVDLGQLWQALFSPIGYLLFLAFLLSFALTNFEAIFGLYALRRYGYGTTQVGVIMTVVGLTTALVQGLLTGPATRRLGEVWVIRTSLLVSAIGFATMLLAASLPTVLLTTSIFVFGNALLRPSVSSLISKRTHLPQGIAMGLNNAFMSLGRIAGPIAAGALLDVSLFLPYLTGAVLMFPGLLSTIPGFANEKRLSTAPSRADAPADS
jgi:DHA1 family multidrug resistance protein-like MFS transporter